MRQICYISSVRVGLTDTDLGAILSSARRRNTALGVTGLLLHDGKRFLQVLEGDAIALNETLSRIRSDERHRAVVVLNERMLSAREFGAWSMAEQRVDPDGIAAEALAAHVDTLTSAVTDKNLRAQLCQFARRPRAVA